jgi:GT2 family glycosyltransferase
MKCLDSVFGQSYVDKEVFVVDNGSFDGTADMVRSGYPEARLISNARNAGAAEARNQAIGQATGEWVLVLDADAFLKEDFLSVFCDFIKGQGGRVAIVAPKIYYPGGSIFYSAGQCLTPLRRFYELGHDKKDIGQFDRTGEVFGACSATALYRRDMLKDIRELSGYFDKDLFYMVEDVDLSWRARKKGWKAYACPACISFHSGSGSGLSAKDKRFFSIRNRFIMMLKNDPKERLFLFLLPLALYEILRFCYLLCKKEGGVYGRAIFSGIEIIAKKERERRGK